MPLDRRSFLSTLALTALASASGRRKASAARKLDRIGIQLYTLRREMARDLPATLARVAEIGYTEVEFAGYFDRSPAEIRDLLARHKLTAPSTHLQFSAMGTDWGKTLDDAKTIGHEWVTIPSIPGSERSTLDGWKGVAARFNTAAAKAKAAGLRFAYHNHDNEFPHIGDVVPFDVLLAETDPGLVDFEMDLYWIIKAGGDPLAYFARFPNRFPLVHVKDSLGAPRHEMADVGRGTIDFRRIFAKSAQAGIRHWFVEHDGPADAFASARASYEYLAKLEF